jgi:hypothetical protein
MMEGTAWMNVMDRQDQSLLIEAVPQPTIDTTEMMSADDGGLFP